MIDQQPGRSVADLVASAVQIQLKNFKMFECSIFVYLFMAALMTVTTLYIFHIKF